MSVLEIADHGIEHPAVVQREVRGQHEHRSHQNQPERGKHSKTESLV